MKLIIQIPCYNEEYALPITLKALPKQIKGIDIIETLLIDDGSTDRSIEIAKEYGVNHIVRLKKNQGLAKGFMAGLDGCLKRGADIIVNTDADNQYCAEDIEKIIQPILEKKADIVIGERPISKIAHFSPVKKLLQKLGSYVVRKASNTNIPDAPSGFRAFSREGAMHMNVVNEYTYTLETIVQAGREGIPITSVPIRTNEELRPSHLFGNTWEYVKKSVLTIIRAYMMYKPLKCFTLLCIAPIAIGVAIGIRFLFYYFTTGGSGHIQSLILACTMIIIGVITLMIGLLADVISANRKIISDMQYRVRRSEYEAYERRSE